MSAAVAKTAGFLNTIEARKEIFLGFTRALPIKGISEIYLSPILEPISFVIGLTVFSKKFYTGVDSTAVFRNEWYGVF